MPNRPITVLYVDDDPALVRLVQRALARHGHTIEHAPDAEAALKRLQVPDIDVIALDHYLPTGTGLDLLAKLAEQPAAPAVVYVTGSAETAIAVAALKAGAADYVAKTVSDDFIELLASAIDQALEKQRLREAKEAAERDVREARDRAEVLLREVNHRVANSLSLVSSMVNLQANTLDDAAAREALMETQARIYAIAAIHKRLYSADDVRFVEIDEYLSGLVEQLDASLTAQGSGAHAVVMSEKLRIATDKAVSIGVAVTELVTNAFKYAYPKGTSGDVLVSLRKLTDSEVVLSVRDHGIGWTGEGEVKGTGLGSRIIRAMATSLGTEVRYNRDISGTEASLTFSPE
ncbi:MAG TPA: response regulator [Devosiaceae bacterium]|jgi:two-component sensor histidine kinase